MKEKIRCAWCGTDPLYIKYHDEEWGRPVHDDQHLFEFLILESFQAGLSWLTILRKRENFRKAFSGFDPVKVSKFDARKKKRLLNDAGIVRNRLKIEAAVNNAVCFLKVQKQYGSFKKYVWSFVDGKPLINHYKSIKEIPSRSIISDALSKDLSLRGFKFYGNTICYAFMQAVGMVDDHVDGCFRK